MLPLKKNNQKNTFKHTHTHREISSVSTECPTAHSFLSEAPARLTGSSGSGIFINMW